MSVLFIDSHVRGQVCLAVFSASGRIRTTLVQGRVNPVVASARFFRAADRAAATGVCVVRGPGPFSVIRSGVLLANVLARILRLPLMSVSAAEAEDLESLCQRLAAHAYPRQSFVAPVYDAEPNIG